MAPKSKKKEAKAHSRSRSPESPRRPARRALARSAVRRLAPGCERSPSRSRSPSRDPESRVAAYDEHGAAPAPEAPETVAAATDAAADEKKADNAHEAPLRSAIEAYVAKIDLNVVTLGQTHKHLRSTFLPYVIKSNRPLIKRLLETAVVNRAVTDRVATAAAAVKR